MITKVELDGKRFARGRNGTFAPGSVEILRLEHEDCLMVEVRSSRSWGTPPIMVEMSPIDAIAVGRALIVEAVSKIKEAENVRESKHYAEDEPERAPVAGGLAPVQGHGDH